MNRGFLEKPIYRVEDQPSWRQNAFFGLQFLVVLTQVWLYPLLIAVAAGMNEAESLNMLSLSVLCGALITFVFGWKRLGVGLTLPSAGAAVYFVPVLIAGNTGGLPLICGMTLFAGLIQLGLTPLIRQFRVVMTPVLAGVVMILLGTWMGTLGIRQVLGSDLGDPQLHGITEGLLTPGHFVNAAIALVSLFIMCGLRVGSPKRGRRDSVIIGVLVGWIVMAIIGNLDPVKVTFMKQAPWFGYPRPQWSAYAFHFRLMPAFLLAAFISCIDIFAKVGSIQRANGADKLDMPVVRRVNAIHSLGLCLTSLVGAIPQTVKTEGIALQHATGIFSRSTSVVVVIVLGVCGFCPKLVALLMTIPPAINGALLLFLAASVVIMGMNLIDFESLSQIARKSFGLTVLLSVCTAVMSGLYAGFEKIGLPVSVPSVLIGVISFFVFEILFYLLSLLKRKRHEA